MRVLIRLNLLLILRDRTIHILLAFAAILMIIVPIISSFSMRQSQEMAVTLSLSFISLILLVSSIILGTTIIWRDIERRYTYAILSLPIDRGRYVLGKFFAVSVFLLGGALIVGCCGIIAIKIGSLQYKADFPVQWDRIALSIAMDVMKYSILTALAMLISTVSTTFFIPVFVTIALFLTGSASQDVYEYICSSHANNFSEFSKFFIKCVYYIIPNLAAFDYKLYAVYPIDTDAMGILYNLVYAVIYTTIILSLAVICFNRREMS
jgi:ABC-type transport system involved in multi-copper enzyme maturation permease subunit